MGGCDALWALSGANASLDNEGATPMTLGLVGALGVSGVVTEATSEGGTSLGVGE